VSAAELAALAGLGDAGTWEVFGRELRLADLDAILFPGRGDDAPVSKRELVGYAARIAPTLLPYLTGRPLTMHRFPRGASARGRWPRRLPRHAPDWLPRWGDPAADPGETSTYLVVDEPAALVWAASVGALEWYAGTSRTRSPHLPTYALVDIEPGGTTTWEQVLTLARLHRTALDHLGVRGQPKLTGRRGIQIWIPIAPGPDVAGTRAWVRDLSTAVGQVVPELVGWGGRGGERGGLARLGDTPSAIGETLVAPYSPRATPGAPVSAPVEWAELDDPALRPDGVTIRTVLDRLARGGDPFRAVLDVGQQLPPLA
jgi:bifunctional non-homologous end joining protein LigD